MGRTKLREKLTNYKDLILGIINAVALLSRTFLVYAGFDSRLATVVYATLFLWPTYIFYRKASLPNLAMSFLQRSRAATYGISFLFLIPINALIVSSVDPASLLLTPVVGLGLAWLLNMGLRRAYIDEIGLTGSNLRNMEEWWPMPGRPAFGLASASGFSIF